MLKKNHYQNKIKYRGSNNSFRYNPEDQEILRELYYTEKIKNLTQKSVSSEKNFTKTLVGVLASTTILIMKCGFYNIANPARNKFLFMGSSVSIETDKKH